MNSCPECGVENPTYSRFCMGCGTGLLVLCPSCGEPTPAEARFCPSCGNLIEGAVGAGGEMIKLVTILFADVVGSTAQAERMDPAQTRALMSDFFETMSKEIRAEGGTIERFIGDAIMAVFGVPVTHEDDQIRAVRAASRMLDALETFNEGRDPDARVQVRVGINTGEVSAGGSLGQQLLVMGDAVNTAARLQQVAEPGTIVIGERTARAVRNSYDLRPLGPLTMKGKSTELPAYVVEGERETDLLQRPTAPMVGREAELKLLEGAFTRVIEERRPHLVAIIGEPGVGKSRLTREFVGSVETRANVLVGRCHPYGNITLQPFREILRDLADLVASDDPSEALAKIAGLVATLPEELCPDRDRTAAALASTIGMGWGRSSGVSRDPRELYRELLAAWQALFSHLSADRSVVVVIEDMHWADNTTLETIEALIENVPGNILFVCPTRPELLTTHADWMAGLRNYSTLRLEPLTSEQSERLVGLILAREELPEHFRQNLLHKAEGYPFFLEEFTNQLIDEGLLAGDGDRQSFAEDVEEVEIPDNVQTVILARLDLLTSEERNVLQHASVIGRTFWPSAVAHLVPVPAVDEVLTALRRRQLVVQRPSSFMPGEEEYTFKHILIRDVAYETLPKQPRGRAHVAAGEWIERVRGERSDEVAELLAHHYQLGHSLLGDDSLRIKARIYALKAAREAARRFAVKQAEELGRRAVSLSAPGYERIEGLEALGDLYVSTSNGDGAWTAFTEAIEEAESAGPAAEDVARLASKAAIVATRWEPLMDSPIAPDRIEELVNKGLAATTDEDRRARALLLASKAYLGRVSDESEETGTAARQALDNAERVDDPALISTAIDALSFSLLPELKYGEVFRLQEQRVELVPRLTDIAEICDVFGSAMWSAVFVGQYQKGWEYATRCIERARGIDPGQYLHGLVWRVQARFMAGDWDGALEDRAAIERFEKEESGEGSLGARAHGVAAFCHELRGEIDEATSCLDGVRRFHEETIDSGPSFAGPLAIPARALAHQGLVDEARTWLRLDSHVYLGGHLEAACEVLATAEDWDAAADVIQLAHEKIVSGELVALRYFVDRLEGRLLATRQEFDRAEALLRRSADGFGDLGAPWEEAWSRQLLGEVLIAAKRQGDAESQLRRALPVFERVRSVAELDRAEKALAQL